MSEPEVNDLLQNITLKRKPVLQRISSGWDELSYDEAADMAAKDHVVRITSPSGQMQVYREPARLYSIGENTVH